MPSPYAQGPPRPRHPRRRRRHDPRLERRLRKSCRRAGVVSSGSAMAPCPWFPEMLAMAAADPSLDLGVHLTLNAEKRPYKWRPLTQPPRSAGLTDEFGYLWEKPCAGPPQRRARGGRGGAARPDRRGDRRRHRRHPSRCALRRGDGPEVPRHLSPAGRRLRSADRADAAISKGGNPRPAGAPALSSAFEGFAAEAASRGRAGVRPLLRDAVGPRPPRRKASIARSSASAADGLCFFAFHFNAPGDFEAVEPQFARYRTDEYALFSSGKIEPLLAELGIELIGMREIRDARRQMISK